MALCVEGISLMPLIVQAALGNHWFPWKLAAFFQYPRMQVSGNIRMGYTIRTHRYRYTEWPEYDTEARRPIWSDETTNTYPELYDHKFDSDENRNVINDPSYMRIRALLAQMLRSGWMSALPPSSSKRHDVGLIDSL